MIRQCKKPFILAQKVKVDQAAANQHRQYDYDNVLFHV